MVLASATDSEKHLEPWAAKRSNSLGRAHKEEEHSYRLPFQRDRDRIIHSAAFRRLESKTQVYTHLYQEGDAYRKRLTHSLEVAGIGRNVARTLGINEDLAETIALAHDLGHAPFGHRGQDILDDLMRDYGGFDHNTQALRIVSLIEHKYPEFYGLNLTYEVREALAKKGKKQEETLKNEFKQHPNPTLEAQVIDLADPIAYSTHDLDDGMEAGTITSEMLEECDFWKEGVDEIRKTKGKLSGKILRSQVVRYIINSQVTDLIGNTRKKLDELSLKSIEELRNHPYRLAVFSPEMEKKHKALKSFLRVNMYEHSRVRRMEYKARKVLRGLFEAFLDDPALFPAPVQKYFQIEKEKGLEKRIVCDYIAGMTDRFALEEYNDIFEPTSKVKR